MSPDRDASPPSRRGVLVVRLATSQADVPPVTHVRSTLITSSLRALGECELLDRYFGVLAHDVTDDIRGAIPGVWLPVNVAMAHYRACEALELSAAQQFEMGRRVGAKIQGTLLGTLVVVGKQAGMTPWVFLERLDRLYERLAVGGAVQVSRLAEKDALVEIYKAPVFETAYFLTAWQGVIEGICDLFCTRAFVKANVRAGRLAAEKTAYTISWA
jgi:hypothetical protein